MKNNVSRETMATKLRDGVGVVAIGGKTGEKGVFHVKHRGTGLYNEIKRYNNVEKRGHEVR